MTFLPRARAHCSCPSSESLTTEMLLLVSSCGSGILKELDDRLADSDTSGKKKRAIELKLAVD